MKPTLDFVPRLFTIEGAVKYSGDSRAKLYADAKAGKLKFVKMDGSTRIERQELDRHIDAKTRGSLGVE